MVVNIYKPTSTFRTLTYQWTEPGHVVVSVSSSTCVVRSIVVNKEGEDFGGGED